MRILVADEHVVFSDFCVKAIQCINHTFQVLEVTDGDSLDDKMHDNHFDLIIIDYDLLPIGETKAKVIVTSERDIEREALHFGECFMKKPFKTSDIKRVIRWLVSRT